MKRLAISKSFFLSSVVLLAYMALILILSIKPVSGVVPGFWQMDKLIHAGVYCVMALLVLWVLGSLRAKGDRGETGKSYAALYAFLISTVFGGAIEVLQSFTSLRQASFYDFIANGVGAFIGVYIIAAILGRIVPVR